VLGDLRRLCEKHRVARQVVALDGLVERGAERPVEAAAEAVLAATGDAVALCPTYGADSSR
jgi:hypothetical protein